MNEIITSVIASLATSSLLAFLFKTWISERLKNAIKSEYDVMLETHKHELKMQADRAQIAIKSDFDAQLDRHRNELKMEADKTLAQLNGEIARDREFQARKIEKLLRQYERQIEEFYGPLWNIVHQIYVCFNIKHKLLAALRGQSAKEQQVDEYFYKTYFSKFHDEIREIMKTKLYLVEGTDTPVGFSRYLEHSLQERDQRGLSSEYGLDTTFVKGLPFPREFHDNIERGFKTAMQNYEDCLTYLKDSK